MQTETERDFILCVADLHAADRGIQIKPGAEDCKAIAARFGLLRLETLNANCTASPWRKKGVSLTGQISARLEQSCIVTLEPVAEEIDISFRALFWPEKNAGELSDEEGTGEIFNDIESDDLPEFFENNEINVGETVLEYFALALDPYPKKTDAKINIGKENSKEAAGRPSPFLVLKGLKNGDE
jgi:uncharacterized metal-binding protein YceD (DUF177 family)